MMTILIAKRLLMGVCILKGLRGLLWRAGHFELFLRQSSRRAMSVMSVMSVSRPKKVEVCDAESNRPLELRNGVVLVS